MSKTTQESIIAQNLLDGAELSYRFCEVELGINHPVKPFKKAIRSLIKQGYDIDIDGFPRINPNTFKDYKVWFVNCAV